MTRLNLGFWIMMATLLYTAWVWCWAGSGLNDAEIICTWCNDNSKSCGACDDGYEGV